MPRHAKVLLAAALAMSSVAMFAQQPPTPQPFPGRSSTPPTAAPAPPPQVPPAQPASAQPSPPRAQAAVQGQPTDAMLGVAGVIFPNSEFLEYFDLGRGAQRCYLFGTNASFLEVLGYYKQALKDNGRELFRAPAMQQFDLGKFQEQTMVYQPSVVVKDYGFNNADGYLHVMGTRQVRYKTVIQIVPVPAR